MENISIEKNIKLQTRKCADAKQKNLKDSSDSGPAALAFIIILL